METMKDKELKICGKTVKMRYCAAAETGFERLAGKSSDVFIPEVEKDSEGNIVNVKQKASSEDYIQLAFAAIIAAYARKGEDSPVSADEILFEARPQEIVELVAAVMELRNEWYDVPATVKPEMEEGEGEKNVQQPATSSKES